MQQRALTAIEVARQQYMNSLLPSPAPLQHPGSSTGNVLPSPRPPTRSRLGPGLSRLRVGSMAVASSSQATPLPPSTPASQPGPSEGRFPTPPGFSANPDTSSSTGNQPSPGATQETHSVPSAEAFPPGFWDDIWKDIPSEFRDDFLKGQIKPRIFHQQDDTC